MVGEASGFGMKKDKITRERADARPRTPEEQAAFEKAAWIEARRPQVTEKDFLRMRSAERHFNPSDPLIPGNEDLLYKSKKDGRLYVPNFMLQFLEKEYDAKWNLYSEWLKRGSWTDLSKALYPDGVDPVSAPTSGLRFTTAERMRAEYRKEQIKRMSPEEAKRAERADQVERETKDLRPIVEDMFLSLNDKNKGEHQGTARSYIAKLRQSGYAEAEIQERIKTEIGFLKYNFIPKMAASERDTKSLTNVAHQVGELFKEVMTEGSKAA